jgi:hypothetical protein
MVELHLALYPNLMQPDVNSFRREGKRGSLSFGLPPSPPLGMKPPLQIRHRRLPTKDDKSTLLSDLLPPHSQISFVLGLLLVAAVGRPPGMLVCGPLDSRPDSIINSPALKLRASCA